MRYRVLTILLILVFLAGCDVLDRSRAPQTLPTVVLDGGSAAPTASFVRTGSEVIASGVVVPGQQAQLSFSLAGKVQSVQVSVGDQVDAGQALVQLEGQERLQAAISAAQFELDMAEQALRDLSTAAETARIQAMQEIVTYEKLVKDARYALDNFTVPSNQADLDAVEALNQMKQRLDEATSAFEPYRNKPSGDETRKQLKEDLDRAQADYNAAFRRLQYEYDLQVAQAKLDEALADYDMYSAGPDPDQQHLAESRRSNAQTQLAAAQAELETLTLSAPFAGTVAQVSINAGEWLLPGQSIIILVDLDDLRVETTDLSERDIPQVIVGQPVTVFIEALGEQVTGRVLRIAPLAEVLGGDVVYKVTIDIDEQPEGLLAGMSVEVEFMGEE